IPVPERVAGPLKVKVALGVFVVTLMVPVAETIVNPGDNVPLCPSGFITTTSSIPTDALFATVRFVTIWVAVILVYGVFGVRPVPPNERTAAGSKLLPTTVKLGIVA